MKYTIQQIEKALETEKSKSEKESTYAKFFIEERFRLVKQASSLLSVFEKKNVYEPISTKMVSCAVDIINLAELSENLHYRLVSLALKNKDKKFLHFSARHVESLNDLKQEIPPIPTFEEFSKSFEIQSNHSTPVFKVGSFKISKIYTDDYINRKIKELQLGGPNFNLLNIPNPPFTYSAFYELKRFILGLDSKHLKVIKPFWIVYFVLLREKFDNEKQPKLDRKKFFNAKITAEDLLEVFSHYTYLGSELYFTGFIERMYQGNVITKEIFDEVSNKIINL